MDRKISVVGLGYVGLPLAVAFGRLSPVIGFDINPLRIKELKNGHDRTREVAAEDLAETDVTYTDSLEDLAGADFHILAVPTPVDDARRPDLRPLLAATETVGRALKPGDIVVFESTVFPGATEEECVPVLERVSGLVCGKDFTVGYSPERANPGDKAHTLRTIVKVVAGQDVETLDIVARTYESVVEAGVHRAASIKVAEAAKVIENTQRDLNIALMNELAILFAKMGIDTLEVLEAAGTKWNFLNFRPGLVGGHCIGVDPYYLTHKAERLGYHPQVILSGRRINDNMGRFIAHNAVKEIMQAGHETRNAVVTVLGLTFKENCPDIRNTRVVDIIREIESFGIRVQVHDPHAFAEDARREYGLELTPRDDLEPACALVAAVAHREFQALGPDQVRALLTDDGIVLDIKGVFEKKALTEAGLRLWRL
jgi:UDP-N-acetyl-D-galactosamine dehydrogenase